MPKMQNFATRQEAMNVGFKSIYGKKPKTPTLWCMWHPDKGFVIETLNSTRTSAVFSLFDYMPADFREKYWKKPEQSARAYRRMGYRARRVKIIPLDSVR